MQTFRLEVIWLDYVRFLLLPPKWIQAENINIEKLFFLFESN